MPAFRHTESRRSRRLSRQGPSNYGDIWAAHSSFSSPASSDDSVMSVLDSDVSHERYIVAPPDASPYPHAYSQSPDGFYGVTPSQPTSSHSRRRGDGHVARPPNAFILFRSDFWAKEKLSGGPIQRDHRDVSRAAAYYWNGLTEAEKSGYKLMAEERKQQHKRDHPDYKYAPAVKKERKNKKKGKRSEEEEERCRRLATLLLGGVEGADLKEAMKRETTPHYDLGCSMRQETLPTLAAPQAAPFHFLPSLSSALDYADGRYSKITSSESTPTPRNQENLEFSSDLIMNDANLDFVPTEDIPHLDLDGGSNKQEEKPDNDLLPRSVAYSAVDSQFGYRPELATFASETSFWYSEWQTALRSDNPSELVYPAAGPSQLPAESGCSEMFSSIYTHMVNEPFTESGLANPFTLLPTCEVQETSSFMYAGYQECLQYYTNYQ